MKKIIFTLVVLMLAAPAWADVDIWCTSDGNEVTVHFDATTEVNYVRAFALDIKLDKDVNIVDVNDEINSDYWVFPGSYPGGTAVGDWEEYDGTLGEEPNQMTIEMGSLYAEDDPDDHNEPPVRSGQLLKFKVDCTAGTGGQMVSVSIAENVIRAGPVVMENPDEDVSGRVNIIPGGGSVECVTCTYPPCWDWLGQCEGDCHGNDGDVDNDDFILFKPAYTGVYPDARYNPCADFDRDGDVDNDDFIIFKPNYTKTGFTGCTPGDPCGIYCP